MGHRKLPIYMSHFKWMAFCSRNTNSLLPEGPVHQRFYAHLFDYVEIDSSFYRIHNVFMVNNWNTKTHKDIKFTAKFPKVITHEKRLKEVDKELDHFFEAMGRLSNKTLALLIQLPPSLYIHEGLDHLRELVPNLYNREKNYRKTFCNPSLQMDNQFSLAVALMEESSANL